MRLTEFTAYRDPALPHSKMSPRSSIKPLVAPMHHLQRMVARKRRHRLNRLLVSAYVA